MNPIPVKLRSFCLQGQIIDQRQFFFSPRITFSTAVVVNKVLFCPKEREVNCGYFTKTELRYTNITLDIVYSLRHTYTDVSTTVSAIW